MTDFTGFGRFVWYDLMSRDVEASRTFYTTVLGWGARADRPLMGRDGQPPYINFTAGGLPFAGIVPFDENYWLGYVAVADVDRSTLQAKELGGEVLFGPHEIERVGRFAVVEDPQGAPIAMFQRGDGAPPSSSFTPEPMEFCWHELAADDSRAALDFYARMLGWEEISEEMGPRGSYLVFGQRGQPYGGIFNRPPGMSANAWCYCVRAADVDEARERVRLNGGQIIEGAMEVARGTRVTRCVDSLGGAFALLQESR